MQIYGERKHTSRAETLKGQAAEIVSKKVPNSDVGFKGTAQQDFLTAQEVGAKFM